MNEKNTSSTTGTSTSPPAKDAAADHTPPSVPDSQKVEETALDHGVDESFPASDPVSVSVTKVLKPTD